MRRLCMVVHGPYPVGEPRVEREALAARAAGWTVDVLAMHRPGEDGEETLDGVRVRRLPIEHRRDNGLRGTIREYASFAGLAGWTLARGCRYDVIQVHAPPDFLIAAALAQRVRGTRLVLDVHDLSGDMFAMRFGDRPGAGVAERVLRVVERAAARLADAVVTVHEPYRRELERRGIPADKLSVLMNGIEESRLPVADNGRPAPNEFRVVYHGTITPPYGVDLIPRAAARIRSRIPGLALELYGEGDDLPAVQRLAAELGVQQLLRTSDGYLAHRDVLIQVSGASVGVVPNRPTWLNRFALSSKLFEYVALGVPVAASDLPTLRAHFSDDEVRYFRAGDDAALADALVDIAADPDGAHRRAANAKKRYDNYRWPTQARRYVALLDRLAT
jgi:glycosyltransferase involved in cell wall biosynthesis